MRPPAKTPGRIMGEHSASDHCAEGCAQRLVMVTSINHLRHDIRQRGRRE
jgi:hypothetical protein